jgi:hypothetical protein
LALLGSSCKIANPVAISTSTDTHRAEYLGLLTIDLGWGIH